MKVVAFSPIRLNSKRVPGKNLKALGNKPLMRFIFDTLLQVENIDEIYAFCSSDSIMTYMPKKIRFLKRNVNLDDDNVKGQQIYDAFINTIDADIYVLAHTTSPFISSRTIENALNHVVSGENDSALSVQRKQTFVWYKGKTLNYSLDNIPRTQDIEPVFVETSGFYIFTKQLWLNKRQRIGNKPFFAEVDNIEGVDIDNPDDFDFAEKLLNLI